VTENSLGNSAQPASLTLHDGHRFELALRGLEGFEYCWVISFFHCNQGWNPLVTPPRGPKEKQGVFATRSPHRPNSIGLSCMKITAVDAERRTIHFLGCDLLDGTAVLDLKPYVTRLYSSLPHACCLVVYLVLTASQSLRRLSSRV
jgi:tRNA (adenine37-N6)-methyltransferase